MPKKIGKADIIGQKGINVIEEVVLSMGFLWFPTGGIEAGIDGIIEIRDSETEVVTNCIIQVQSKATQQLKFLAETEYTFEFRCEERDLDYWLHGNAPVILVIVKAHSREAYWISIKDYFCDAKRKVNRKILFDKQKDRFDVSAKEALLRLAIPKTSGIYLAPKPRKEKLYSNLLRVARIPKNIYSAYTNTEDESRAYSQLLKSGRNLGQEWLLKEGLVLSFHNLRESPWSEICDAGTVEQHDIEDWASSSRLEKQQEFVQLLNRALREKVKDSLSYHQQKELYYFRPTEDLTPLQYSYTSIFKRTHRTVFQPYYKRDTGEVAYYRHSAFEGRFLRINSKWLLEITPTYFFTRDGFIRDKFEKEKLSGIKRLEKNSAVLGQLIMWAEFLKTPEQRSLFSEPYSFLEFSDLEELEIEVGIDDNSWLQSEEEEEAKALSEELDDLPLFQSKHEN